MRLLIAEDEVDLAEALTVFFERNQFTVDTVHDGLAACEYAAAAQYDAIILDVMMPKMDGIAVLQHLRRQGIKTPVMMLTAKAEKNDRITGFDSGADDYLPKPFEPDELISRVRAMLRRREDYRPTVLTFGNVTLNTATGVLSHEKDSVRLSGREFQLMELFLGSPGLVLSASASQPQIRSMIWSAESTSPGLPERRSLRPGDPLLHPVFYHNLFCRRHGAAVGFFQNCRRYGLGHRRILGDSPASRRRLWMGWCL